ncbi:MAG TPA: helix-turn-helix transcriptional regulator [Vicinamibacterales bacterium]|nr:helix-turn-helix transcriptional regulator [Vicinamibacterales bacterium]
MQRVPAATLGDFELLVLMAVLRLDNEASGSAVRDEIEARTTRRVSRGAAYVTLDRLQDKGLLTSRVVDAPAEAGGRPRRRYRVTSAGRKAAAQSLGDLVRMRSGIERILAGVKPS